jgi:glycosyltransferase involved in cell wall biosynthesis
MQSLNNKKATFLISSLSGGGAEGVCVNVANGLTDIGWEVNLVVLHLKNSAYRDRVSEKVNLVVLGVNHARSSSLALLRYIRQNKPKTILVFNYELPVILVILRSLFRLKTKIVARNINTLSQQQALAKGFWLKYVVMPFVNKFYIKADHIINQCEAMREDLLALYPHNSIKSSVIYNPLAKHIEDYAQSIDLKGVDKHNYLLCIGRLEMQKGFHLAIEAFAKLSSEFPTLRLKIIGKGSLELELKELVLRLGIVDRVDFEGFQKDMIPFYLHAKATILTSLYEGFPNVLIESIGIGTPVVAFDCPSGPKEIIINGSNGYLVKNKCLIDLGDKLRLALNKQWDSSIILNSANPYYLENIVHKYVQCFQENEL